MARVLVLTSTFPRWERDTVPPFIYYLSAGLAQRGHEIHVLAPHARGAAIEERLGDVHVHRFRYLLEKFESLCYEGGMTNNLSSIPIRWGLVPFFLVSELAATIYFAYKYKIELIHAHWFLPQGLVAAIASLVLPCPIMMTAHGSDIFATKGRFRRALLRLAARRANICTVNSNAVSAQLYRMTEVTARPIPMGVDTTRFHPSIHNGTQRPTASYPRILFVGRLVEQKGLKYLIQAMKEVCASFPKAELTVVGEGPEKPVLQKLTDSLGLTLNVRFVGPIANEDLPLLYSTSDLIVVPSIESQDGSKEALGIVILEAAASGTSIIATKVGGIPDFIQHGKNGVLVEPADPHGLAQSIIEVVSDERLRARITSNARSLVEADYSWKSVVDRFDLLIRELLCSKDETVAEAER